MKLHVMPRCLVVLLGAVLGASAHAGAASVVGRVSDRSGGSVPGASVVLRDAGSGGQQWQTTGPDGRFRFHDLAEGEYALTVTSEGRSPYAQHLSVAANGVEELTVSLEPSSGSTLDPQAEQPDAALPAVRLQERVNVIGDASAVRRIPGSAHFLDDQELEGANQAFGDIHHVLRRVPGVNLQDEEGYGLRPNIGMRGTGSERSSKITLMEDGVLIAPAPYAAPSAYYFPVTGRMRSLEVRKGSSQIKHGPNTNGGVLNLVSTGIPERLRLAGAVSGGSDGARKLHAHLGSAHEHVGWLVEAYQSETDGFKRLDGGGPTGFDVGDLVAKLRVNSSPRAERYQELELKLGRTRQTSHETYLGLTDEDFSATPLRRYPASQRDLFESEHEQYQLRHFVALSPRIDLTSVAYRNDFHRNWYKLQSIGGAGLGDIFRDPEAHTAKIAVARGADSAPDALEVRANDRRYRSQGIQSVLGVAFASFAARHQLEAGVRYHEDREDRFQHQDGYRMDAGRMLLTRAGAPGSQSNRIAEASAWAFFVQDRIEWSRLTLTPGLRVESIELLRTDFATTDAERTDAASRRANDLFELIPGIGLDYRLRPGLNVFGGVHRGFSPPGPGSTEETRSESSVNYELGLRGSSDWWSTEAIGFYGDYSNLLGADTLSAGGSGDGALFNGGAVRVGGLELSLSGDLLAGGDWSAPLSIAYTLTSAEFRSSFDSDFEAWGAVEAGDALPYLPTHQLFLGLGLQHARFRLALEASYVSRMRTEAGQGPIPEHESTDPRLVVNLSGALPLGGGLSLFANVQNLTDERHIVARRPAGARPGLPRSFFAGLEFDLGGR